MILCFQSLKKKMLICAKKGCEQQIIDIFQKWELDEVLLLERLQVVGIWELFWHGESCHVPVKPGSEEYVDLIDL